MRTSFKFLLTNNIKNFNYEWRCIIREDDTPLFIRKINELAKGKRTFCSFTLFVLRLLSRTRVYKFSKRYVYMHKIEV